MVTPRTEVTPLIYGKPIIDPDTGSPTMEFMHIFNLLLQNEFGTKQGTAAAQQSAEDAEALAAAAVPGSRLVIAGTGLTGGGDLTADRTFNIDTTAEAERVRDVIGAALVAGSNITITVNDAGDTITIASTGGGSGSWPERSITKPAVASFTLQNVGTAAASDVTNGVFLSVPTVASGTIRFLKYTAGPASFTSFTMIMRSKAVNINNGASYPSSFILRNSSSGKILIFSNHYQQGTQYLCQRWTNYTSFSANSIGPSSYNPINYFPWQKLTVAAGVATFYMSPDGINWITLGTETISTFISSVDEVGIGAMTNTAAADTIFQSFEIA
jgi:hypothetical protein